MTPIPAARYAVFALTTLALGGCYYTSPYGYAPYYAPAPATLTQREIPVTPAAPATTAKPAAAAVAPPVVDPAPVYVAPAYPPPYPYPYPYYAPRITRAGTAGAHRRSRSASGADGAAAGVDAAGTGIVRGAAATGVAAGAGIGTDRRAAAPRGRAS